MAVFSYLRILIQAHHLHAVLLGAEGKAVIADGYDLAGESAFLAFVAIAVKTAPILAAVLPAVAAVAPVIPAVMAVAVAVLISMLIAISCRLRHRRRD